MPAVMLYDVRHGDLRRGLFKLAGWRRGRFNALLIFLTIMV
jgi:hypothetical protein